MLYHASSYHDSQCNFTYHDSNFEKTKNSKMKEKETKKKRKKIYYAALPRRTAAGTRASGISDT
jgi:hypothetical protein